ncbi:hypothetical protein [Herbiconiux liukaitaii]|uniref:hypothetical protein n=1 Tax=Herbiconiux liukaitaii TaxID=3342799 RepID=UPI0035B8EFD0
MQKDPEESKSRTYRIMLWWWVAALLPLGACGVALFVLVVTDRQWSFVGGAAAVLVALQMPPAVYFGWLDGTRHTRAAAIRARRRELGLKPRAHARDPDDPKPF